MLPPGLLGPASLGLYPWPLRRRPSLCACLPAGANPSDRCRSYDSAAADEVEELAVWAFLLCALIGSALWLVAAQARPPLAQLALSSPR